MKVDIVFDVVCPWCFIGIRRFRRARALRPDVPVEIRWRPFLLNPEIPAAGIDRAHYLERKFGNSHRVERIHAATRQAGQSEGIDFDFAAIRRMPSSIDAHRLIQWAEGDKEALLDRIFTAFFIEGRDIGDIGVLEALAVEAGLNGQDVGDYLRGADGIDAIEADNARMRRWGVSGVPCFIFEENYAVAGAQDPDLLARLMDIAVETDPESFSTA